MHRSSKGQLIVDTLPFHWTEQNTRVLDGWMGQGKNRTCLVTHFISRCPMGRRWRIDHLIELFHGLLCSNMATITVWTVLVVSVTVDVAFDDGGN